MFLLAMVSTRGLTTILVFLSLLSWGVANVHAIQFDAQGIVLDESVSALRERLLDPARYDRQTRPLEGISNVDINIQFHVMHIYDIDFNNQAFSLAGFLRQRWTDPQLAWNSTLALQVLKIHKLDTIWLPDTFFANSLSQNEREPAEGDAASTHHTVRISRDGSILYSQMLDVKLTSPMKLSNYPFDIVDAVLTIESYGYRADEIVFSTNADALTFEARTLNAPAFHVSFAHDQSNAATTFKYSTGEFPAVVLKFRLGKLVKKDLLLVVLPVSLLIFLNSLIFWLPPVENIADRVALGITSLLTAFAFSFTLELPQLGYLNWVEIYVLIAYIFIFLSLAESCLEYKRHHGFLSVSFFDKNSSASNILSQTGTVYSKPLPGARLSVFSRPVHRTSVSFTHDQDGASPTGIEVEMGEMNASSDTTQRKTSDVEQNSGSVRMLERKNTLAPTKTFSLDYHMRYLYIIGWVLVDVIMIIVGFASRSQ